MNMKRIAAVLIVAVLGLTALVGVAAANGKGSPTAQNGTTGSQRAWLGADIANISENWKAGLNLTVDTGVVVIKVASGSPASVAGMKVGDVILDINDTAVQNVGEVTSAIQKLDAGAAVTIKIMRGNAQMSLTATMGMRPTPPAPAVPEYLRGLLGSGLLSNLLTAQVQVLGQDGNPVTVGITLGKVQSVNGAALTIVRKDSQAVTFQTTADTQVLVGKRAINLSGLKADTPVVVVEKAGAVALVVAWPGDVVSRFKPLAPKAERHGKQDDERPAIWRAGKGDITGQLKGLKERGDNSTREMMRDLIGEGQEDEGEEDEGEDDEDEALQPVPYDNGTGTATGYVGQTL